MTLPLLLLPGMMCDARLFAPQVAELSGDRSVTVPAITNADTVNTLARHVLDDAPEAFALGGLSMGGIVAMEMARLAPDRVRALALMDTNPLAEAEGIKAGREPQIARVEAGELASIMRNELKPNYLTDSPDRDAILELCMEMAMALGPLVFANQSRALRDRPDQTATLHEFQGPALVLCGREDQLCPPSRHQLMHELMPESTLVVIDGAGHLPTLEQPEDTTAALRHWLMEI